LIMWMGSRGSVYQSVWKNIFRDVRDILKDIADYREVQTIAKKVLDEIHSHIDEFSTEKTIAAECVNLLKERGIIETWYYDTPAMVLSGPRTCLSVSGRDYMASDEPVGKQNLITIDLSPVKDGIWGDRARSYVVASGKVVLSNFDSGFSIGLEKEKSLHKGMKLFVTEETTFEELYFFANDIIEKSGFENLDYLGNLGHSIEKDINDRVYIEKGNDMLLSSVSYFTFEPHIRAKNGGWGFKHENIYYLDDEGKVMEL